MKKDVAFVLMLKKLMAYMGAFVCVILVACTDYLQKLEDEHDEWLAQQSETVTEQSSSSISDSKLSSETRLSSSNRGSVPAEESSSAESILSSSDEAELSSSSSFDLPEVVCKESSSTVENVAGSKKVIRFMPPWTNTSAVMIVNGEESNMVAAPDYCGWFEAIIELPEGGLSVYFKQTVGPNFVGSNGLVETKPTISTEINLDSLAALSDTLWIIGQSVGKPGLYTCYPGILGDCPIRKLPVMMFDWLHGDKGDGSGEGKNGDPVNGVSADFGSGGCAASGRPMKGMVERYLGPNGVPVRATEFPEKCKITEHLDSWFIPESLAVDGYGNTLTNATCRDLYISLDSSGYWLAEISKNAISKGNEANRGGLFLLDDFDFLDSAKTISNPYYDQLSGGDGERHNYGFTMKIQATFEYVPGQYFDFYGDDDVWVFINNVLVVDIGGQHPQMAGAVDLDTLGLTVGETYPFHIFYAERHINQSNFRMHTSIDLKSDSNSPCR